MKGSRKGQAVVEAALLLPMLLILMLNGVNFGIYLYAWVTVSDAARAAAEYAVDNGVAAGFQPRPWPSDITQIEALVDQTSSTLPGYVPQKNPTVEICSNSNGNVNCSASTYPAPAADPTEPASYTVYSADVTYTFKPFFSSSNGMIALTLPDSTIHQRVLMRSMQ